MPIAEYSNGTSTSTMEISRQVPIIGECAVNARIPQRKSALGILPSFHPTTGGYIYAVSHYFF